MTLTHEDQKLLDGLKFVRNAHIIKEGSVYKIIHYETEIFCFDTKTDQAWCLKNCSLTSNRQIKYCMEFFCVDLKKLTTELNPGKWEYSRPI